MKVYGLTDVGKAVVSNKTIDSDEYRVLAAIKEGGKGGATDSELSEKIPDGQYIVRKLVSNGLVRIYTT